MESPTKFDFWIGCLLLQAPKHFEYLNPEVAQQQSDSESQRQTAWEKKQI